MGGGLLQGSSDDLNGSASQKFAGFFEDDDTVGDTQRVLNFEDEEDVAVPLQLQSVSLHEEDNDDASGEHHRGDTDGANVEEDEEECEVSANRLCEERKQQTYTMMGMRPGAADMQDHKIFTPEPVRQLQQKNNEMLSSDIAVDCTDESVEDGD